MSLKSYFGYRQTIDWCREIVTIAASHPATLNGRAELFVLPSFPVIAGVLAECEGAPVGVGAQDLFWEDRGPFTGEVTGALLAEMGCRYVAVGHVERRRLFGETDVMVSRKVAAAVRNQMTPVICIGETDRLDAAGAGATSVEQLERALSDVRAAGPDGRIIVAYEPAWAIGADAPAPIEHIRAVVSHLRAHMAVSRGLASSPLIYGGTAGPSLLTELKDDVEGLFIGRRGHDPGSIKSVLDEVLELSSKH